MKNTTGIQAGRKGEMGKSIRKTFHNILSYPSRFFSYTMGDEDIRDHLIDEHGLGKRGLIYAFPEEETPVSPDNEKTTVTVANVNLFPFFNPFSDGIRIGTIAKYKYDNPKNHSNTFLEGENPYTGEKIRYSKDPFLQEIIRKHIEKHYFQE